MDILDPSRHSLDVFQVSFSFQGWPDDVKPLAVTRSPFLLFPTSQGVSYFHYSNPTSHSDPLELIFGKLNHLENQMVDIQATTLTQMGPTSRHNCSNKNCGALPTPYPPKKHWKIARLNDSSSLEEELTTFTLSCVLPFLKEKLHLALLRRYHSPQGRFLDPLSLPTSTVVCLLLIRSLACHMAFGFSRFTTGLLTPC